uniref:cyclin-dependent kinase F-4-like n=1 Tax=Erigeron canadensis TaxID=72917 RepID=UPI001CB940AC|nr:cyclin-dependent kinase F-4-like [Erigeron canadensis]
MEKYALLEEVGSGSFGVVWKAYNTQTGEIVAIKNLFTLNKSWEVEVEALYKFNNHPNIVSLKELSIQENNDTASMVFEYMECNLFECMMNRKIPFSETEIKQTCEEAFLGLAHMHHHGYFHRDLKPENLLVSGRGTVKIGDLGSARDTKSTLPLEHEITSHWYRAPEVFLRSQTYDSAVDMWAMGTIMAELFSFRPLFEGLTNSDVMDKHCSVLGSPTEDTWSEGLDLARNLYHKFPEDVAGVPFSELLPNASLAAVNLIASLLSWDPKDRPTAMEALQHPFFRDWYNHPIPSTTYFNSFPSVFIKAMKREGMKGISTRIPIKSSQRECGQIYIGSVKLPIIPNLAF